MEQQSMGKRISQLRKEKGYTQEQLAEKMGVSAQAVSKWENDVSCPDISILPKLAEVLGVSTDELLGVKPIEPHVVIVDSQSEKKKGNKNFIFDWDIDSKKDGVWFAVMVIVLGLAFLLQRIGSMSFGIWGIVWPAVIIALGLSWFIRRFSVFSLAVIALGTYFLLFNLNVITIVLTWSIIWPSLLILLGLAIIFRAFRPRRHKWKEYCTGDGSQSVDYSEEDGFINYDCSFCDENRKLILDELSGGDVDLSFGKCVVDLTEVKRVKNGAVLDIDVSFGSCDLIVPRTFKVLVRSDKAFGSVQTFGSADSDASEVLAVKGDVSFGNLNVRYR
jgi:transcriptional regulator with XRE-family HTH domain